MSLNVQENLSRIEAGLADGEMFAVSEAVRAALIVRSNIALAQQIQCASVLEYYRMDRSLIPERVDTALRRALGLDA